MPRKRSERIYLRIDPDLKEQVQDYCDRKKTKMSDLVIRFLVRLLEEDRKQQETGVEQL